jgi:hypothetical protein
MVEWLTRTTFQIERSFPVSCAVLASRFQRWFLVRNAGERHGLAIDPGDKP